MSPSNDLREQIDERMHLILRVVNAGPDDVGTDGIIFDDLYGSPWSAPVMAMLCAGSLAT